MGSYRSDQASSHHVRTWKISRIFGFVSQMLHFCQIFFFFNSRSNSFVLIGCGFQRRKLLSLEACESTVFQLLGGDGFSEICLSFARGDIALRHRLTHLSVVSQHVCSSRPSPPPLQQRRAAPPRLPLWAASTSRRCGILPDRAARHLWQTVVD